MISKKKFYAIVAVIAVAGAGLGVGLAVTSSSSQAHPLLLVMRPPANVNATCTHDDTYTLGNFLLSVPNGTPGHDTKIKLAQGACYEINGSIWWRGARNIILNGNGATIKQESVAIPDAEVGGENNPTVAPYCGSTADMNDLYSGNYSDVIMFSFEGGCDITIENLTIIGMHTGVGSPAGTQPDSFIGFGGTQRALVKNVTMVGPYGDYVDASGLHEAYENGPTYPSTDITVEDCTFSDSGRSGVTVTNGAHRVTVEDNTFKGIFQSAASAFDDETDVTYPAAIDTDFLVEHNTFIGETYSYLFTAITGTEMQRIAFNDNTLTDGAQIRIILDPHAFGGSVNNSVQVEGNTSTASTGWPNEPSPVTVYNVTDVLVEGNTDAAPTGRDKGHAFATFVPKTGDLACGNTFDSACPTPLPLVIAPTVATLPT